MFRKGKKGTLEVEPEFASIKHEMAHSAAASILTPPSAGAMPRWGPACDVAEVWQHHLRVSSVG